MQLRRVSLLLVLLSASAHADGSLSMRGMYYRERSTLVRQPMIDARLDVGENGTLDGHLLVDAITSASAAAGTAQRFSELRYEGGVGYTHRLGDTSVGATGRYSTENDYTSLLLGGNAEFRLLEENTTLRVALGLGFDTITNGVAQEQGGLGIQLRSESLSSSLSSFSLTQLLSPQLVANVTYDFMLLDGYQANMYRVVLGGMIPAAERVPDLRVRHAVSGSVRGYLPWTHTTAILAYRYYSDDWEIRGHTPEVRLVQEIVPGLDVRAKYRHHRQTAAFFWKPVYTQAEIDDPAQFISDDEKLSDHHTDAVGGQVSLLLAVLGVSGQYASTRVDIAVEHLWQSTAFGNAWIGNVGLTIPLVY